MNIQSMVGMGFMMRNVQASLRKAPNKEADKPTAFEQRLYDFREQNAMDRLKEPEKKEITPDKKDEDWQKMSFSNQLFGVWDSSLSAEETLEKLEDNLSQIGEYSINSNMGPREVLQHIAAQYSIHKKHLAGDTEQLEALDKMIGSYTNKFATELADSVGAFYESNGVEGERNRVYESAMNSVKGLTKLYDRYIENNKTKYSNMETNAHQSKQSLANELRRAVFESGAETEGASAVGHNSLSLERITKLAKVSHSIERDLATVKVTNEEELGILLGKNIISALSHVYCPDNPMDANEVAFFQSVQEINNRYMDKVDGVLDDNADDYRSKSRYNNDNPYNSLDREAVTAVINVMANEYTNTLSRSAALEKGKAFGLKQYLSKADVDSESKRYQGSTYWENTVKELLSPDNEAVKQYRWIQKLMDTEANSWLNLFA